MKARFGVFAASPSGEAANTPRARGLTVCREIGKVRRKKENELEA